MIISFNRILAGLGPLDFDRTRTLADQIGRPEMRVLMEIDLVRTTLGGKSDMNQMFSSGRANLMSIN
jgi:hypothetical protein